METSPRRLVATPLLVLLALSSCAQAAAAQSTESRELKPTLRDIEAAWKKRTDAIGSIAMKADVDRFIKGRGDQPVEDVGPFSDSRPSSGRVFKVALEYAYEQGKTAFMRSGPIISGDDPEKTEEQTRCHTFDGLEYRTYIKQGTFPQSGSIEKKAIASGPILYMELMAIELWSHPKFVLRPFKSEEMRVEDDLVEVDGTTCRRIRLQRAGSNRLSTIDVNPKLDCVPVQLQNRSGDRPSMKLTIKYDVDPKIGPVVKEWVHTNYDSAGALSGNPQSKSHAIPVKQRHRRRTFHNPISSRNGRC